MNTAINLQEIFIANIMGIMLAVSMLLGNSRSLRINSHGHKYIREMLWIAMAGCIIDPIVFICDGKPGFICFLVVYVGNLLLFLSNLIVCPLWVAFTAGYMSGRLTDKHIKFIYTLCAIGGAVLAINLFTPIVFGVGADNRYYRCNGYFIYTAMQMIFILDGLIMYIKAKKKSGVLRFFPVWVFLLPALTGIGLQAACYGISTIWPFGVIAVTAILSGMNNELAFRDNLTGVYNKQYLEMIQKRMLKAANKEMTLMMIDMNNFKSINDRFGHQEGDRAIKETARILAAEVKADGSVVRYAGDEFIILFNPTDENRIYALLVSIQDHLDAWTRKYNTGYELSVSVGYKVFNFANMPLDEMLRAIDEKMYEDKKKFYEDNPKQDRRSH